ncbi:YfhO family protein [Enterococcus rivorum]|uniref:YfhO family protein n=1 Tax=Enterococcus rivorum TaxID=762845 RepID=UPI0036414CF9
MVKQYLKINWKYLILSFLIPLGILSIIYFSIGIYPGSQERTILASDSFSQFSNFFSGFKHVLSGEQSIFYTWNSSLGLNYWSFMAYYLGGIFTPLVVFFEGIQITDFIYGLTLLKIGLLGCSFYFFSSQMFKLARWKYLVLSLSYSLMSFVLAYSEIIMWLDALIYLPLVILGIHRIFDRKKPLLLFVSYSLLFVSNFYIAFMIGLFSVFYLLLQLILKPENYLKKSAQYLITLICSLGVSSVVLLPTFLDIKNNGEAWSAISTFKTADTGPWDLAIKNMIGVYDTTKFGSTPYIFVGLWTLILCLFFFMTKKVALKEKIGYGSLLFLLIVSFYVEPLNLFWHGMHSPAMFLFRFSFLFSFVLILLAGYGWVKLESTDYSKIVSIVFFLLGIFVWTKFITDQGKYDYLYTMSFVWSVLFLLIYLLFAFLLFKKKWNFSWLICLFVCLIGIEMGLNGYGLVRGILLEWNYPARSYYAKDYPAIRKLVDQTKQSNKNFYRLENLTPVSANDAFNYGYSGVSQFSSIRNRRSAAYLNQLGFRSAGTNLNIRYANNTLLMDSLLGIKYNLSRQPIMKYGYEPIEKSGDFTLYKNDYALPLGYLTDKEVYSKKTSGTQVTLFNHLAEMNDDFFTVIPLKSIQKENLQETTEVINHTTIVSYKPYEKKKPMEITWQVKIPANKQAYLSLYPVDYKDLRYSNVEITVDGNTYKHSVVETGQYYTVGYYPKDTVVTIKASFTQKSGKRLVRLVEPDIALLDVGQFTTAVEKIKSKGVNFKTEGRKATAEVLLREKQVLFTTIPYDKGWQAYVNGKKVEILPFENAFLSLQLNKGEIT